MKPKTLFILGMLVVAIVMLVAWAAIQQSAPSKFDGFAQCLKEKGATFYGAFWCPHCQDQKKLFGTAKRLLPYVECSTPNGNGQLPVCIEKVMANPTAVAELKVKRLSDYDDVVRDNLKTIGNFKTNLAFWRACGKLLEGKVERTAS